MMGRPRPRPPNERTEEGSEELVEVEWCGHVAELIHKLSKHSLRFIVDEFILMLKLDLQGLYLT